MSWVAGEVDGVAIKRRSIIGTGEWGAAKDKMIELMAAQLSDRKDMGESVADSFADSGDVSGGICTSGYVKNTETAAVVAQSGSNIVSTMSSNTSPSGYVASASSIEGSSYDAYKAFDCSTGTFWSGSMGSAAWLQLKVPTAKVVDSYTMSFRCYNNQDPAAWQFQGSTNGSSWITLDSRSGISPSSERTFSFSNSSPYLYYRLYITANGGNSWVVLLELKIFSKDIPGAPAYANPTVITVTPYTPDNTLEKIRVTLMLEDVDNSGAIALGDDVADLLQAYLSYDGNSTFGSALTFSEEPYPLTDGSNIYVFNSDDVDVSAENISALGMKLQSFDRGSGAPEFRFHAYIIAGKEIENE